jgi:tripartite ATP-independent transporter DctP family solute receptor
MNVPSATARNTRVLQRREILAAAFAAAWPGGRGMAAPSAPRRLRMGYLLASNSQLGAGVAAMADEVARRSFGAIQIQPFPDASLGGEVDMLKAVQRGTLDLAFITGAPLPSILPEAGVFNIPFLFKGASHAQTVLDGPVGEHYLSLLSGKGLVALAWGENGMRHITNSKRPIVDPEDLKGLRLRLPQSPVMLAAFRALGAQASPLPFPQLYHALETGVFDGQENPIATIISAKFARVQQFLTLSGHVYDPAVFVMSSSAYADLSAQERSMFQDAARIGALASRSFAAAAQSWGIVALKEAGMQLTVGIDRPRFVKAMAAANPEFDGLFGRQRIEQVRGDF